MDGVLGFRSRLFCLNPLGFFLNKQSTSQKAVLGGKILVPFMTNSELGTGDTHGSASLVEERKTDGYLQDDADRMYTKDHESAEKGISNCAWVR